jgi:sigma-B regulation protein RsbU (phosphoserine phosphatase)
VLLWLAVAYAALMILYSCLWMYSVRHSIGTVELGFDSGYSETDHWLQVQKVEKGSPAEQAGMRVGDLILDVDGHPLQTRLPLDEVWLHAKPGDSVELTVRKPGQQAATILRGVFRLAKRTSQETGVARASALEVTRSYPVLFIVVGLSVLFLRLEDRNAWLLALLFGGFVAVPQFGPLAVLDPALRVVVTSYRSIFLGMFSALFYLFFALFPVRSPLDRLAPWLKWLGAIAGVCVIPAGFWHGDVSLPAFMGRLMGRRAADQAVLLYIYGFVVLGLVSLAANALRAPVADAKRKARVLLWGTIVGVLPAAAEKAAIDFAGYHPSFWMDMTLGLVVLLYPLSFGYAVVKHRVLEIPLLLRRSARYVLVQRGYVVLLFLVAAGAIGLFTRTIARFFAANASVGMGVSAVFGIALVWVSAPMVRRGTARIDRAFFRTAYDARIILQDLAERARTVTDRHELAELLKQHIEGALQPQSLVCYLETDGGQLAVECGDVPTGLERISADMPVLAELVRRGKSWEVPLDDPGRESSAGALARLAPECLVPILGRDSRLMGLLVLSQRRSEEPYSGEDKHLLDSAASQAGVTLENITLAEKMAERMEAEHRRTLEMDIARQVQARLFPQNLPPLQTLEYSGGCLQALQIGGDYYDFLDMGPGKLGIVLADIAGKGMSGAMLMANLQANLRSQYAVAMDDLPRLLHSVNRLFFENTAADSYATMFFGVYDDATRTLRYANCGHVAPLLLRADGFVQHLGSTTTVLGMFLEWECPVAEEKLHPGDLLVICTDGATEAADERGEEFGEERIADATRENRHLPVAELLLALQARVLEFSRGKQADDLTLIIARCR